MPNWLSRPTDPCSEALPFVSVKRGFMQCLSPKAGSVEWHKLLNWIEVGTQMTEALRHWHDCDFTVAAVHNFSYSAVERAMQPGAFFKFAVVRNPVVRLLSATLHKGIGKKGSSERFHEFMCGSILSHSTEEGEAMHTCAGNAPFNLHGKWQHWYPQHCRCGMAEGIQFDLILRMERTAQHLDELAERGLVPRNYTSTGWGKAGTSAFFSSNAAKAQEGTHRMGAASLERLGRYYSEALFDATVRDRRREIDVLGYTKEVKELRLDLSKIWAKDKASGHGTNGLFERSGACQALAREMSQSQTQVQGSAIELSATVPSATMTPTAPAPAPATKTTAASTASAEMVTLATALEPTESAKLLASGYVCEKDCFAANSWTQNAPAKQQKKGDAGVEAVLEEELDDEVLWQAFKRDLAPAFAPGVELEVMAKARDEPDRTKLPVVREQGPNQVCVMRVPVVTSGISVVGAAPIMTMLMREQM
eukprot:g1834.t1